MATRKQSSDDPTTDRPDATLDSATAADVTPADDFSSPPSSPEADAVVEAVRAAVAELEGPEAADALAELVRSRVGPHGVDVSPCAALRGVPVLLGRDLAGAEPVGRLEDLADVEATRAALRRPLPPSVAAAFARPADGADPAPIALPGGGSLRPDPAVPGALDVVRGLYDSAAGFRLLDVAGAPWSRSTSPRVALREPDGALSADGRDVPASVVRHVGAGEALYRCHLTGRYFVLPARARVPCLEWDALTGNRVAPRVRPVLPALVEAGAEAVRLALWRRPFLDVLEAADLLLRSVEGFGLALSLGDAAVPVAWPSAPANWRQLEEK
ncbi:hypothetical protein [Rubrivirga marina]|uniref:Uncharacterized protein n=1 Tax=Rubrivirga marina TaxID=1196024 RepID=A0A271J3T2_9BACT|nr:hypothetical protein [Rubrivirga marina]PAP78010.1 hypothetical protein BSZ37_16965 [Rubrivirga marina]